MIRTFLCMGDKAADAVIVEGLDNATYSHDGPRLKLATVYMQTYCHACKRPALLVRPARVFPVRLKTENCGR